MVYLVKNTLNVFSDKLGDFHFYYLIINESPLPPSLPSSEVHTNVYNGVQRHLKFEKTSGGSEPPTMF